MPFACSQPISRGHRRTESGNIWEEEDRGGGGGGGSNSVVHGRMGGGNDGKGFLGAMKTAQVGTSEWGRSTMWHAGRFLGVSGLER